MIRSALHRLARTQNKHAPVSSSLSSLSSLSPALRTPHTHTQRCMSSAVGGVEYDWQDSLNIEDQLTDEERMIRDTARSYAQDHLQPRIIDSTRNR